MNRIKKPFLFFSLAALSCSVLDAASIHCILDQKNKNTFIIDRHKIKNTSIKRFVIENKGDKELSHCPITFFMPTLSLESLAKILAKEPYPVLSLYDLWKKAIVCDESVIDEPCHPLDLLNFKGKCSPKTFKSQFIKLCHLLGIETRLANIQGKEVYDFGLEDNWSFLDLSNNQIYLGLDNETVVSSEEVMDDPFIALRTKHKRDESQLDFRNSWTELAAFDIIDQISTLPEINSASEQLKHPLNVHLYPRDSFTVTHSSDHHLSKNLCQIEQTLDLTHRFTTSDLKISFIFPISQIVNNSSSPIEISEIDKRIEKGETYALNQPLDSITVKGLKTGKGYLTFRGISTVALLPCVKAGKNTISLGNQTNKTTIEFSFETIENDAHNVPQILNKTKSFNHCTPNFQLNCEGAEKIQWQIAMDSQFKIVPTNLDQIQIAASNVSLSSINETFLNPDSPYYFRVKGYKNGQWTDWSSSYAFVVLKPAAVEEANFEENEHHSFELNWERYAEKTDGSIEYLIFGSNSLDFVPSIYFNKQVNAIENGKVIEEEEVDNLIALTHEPRIQVNGNLAYYRIIAREKGQLSVPSKIITVYDHEFIQPRNVLQKIKEEGHFTAKRTIFPAAYPWTVNSLPKISKSFKFPTIKMQSLLRSVTSLKDQKLNYEFPDVPQEVWDEVTPFLLPEGHPAWPKLNRIFCRSRVTQTPLHFKKAGFRRWKPGRWSRVAASGHFEIPNFFIKAYCDNEIGILYDWKRWIHRIEGAEIIRTCIQENNLGKNFKVPRKWIYPLPKHPSPPNSPKYLRKNFVLVCQNMQILEHSDNDRKYKHDLTPDLMRGLYKILQICGLYDSVYVFNMPFCKDGKIAIIDTEYWHRWPVPYKKLTSHFPKKLRGYWEKLTLKGGRIPDGETKPQYPRMDRRDLIPKN